MIQYLLSLMNLFHCITRVDQSGIEPVSPWFLPFPGVAGCSAFEL